MGDSLLNDFRESIAVKGVADSAAGHAPVYGIVAIIFFSIIGCGYFLYGKKSANYVFLICGIILTITTIFSSPLNVSRWSILSHIPGRKICGSSDAMIFL